MPTGRDTLAGTFTLTVSAAGVTSVESNSYSIAPGAGVLSFVSQPSKTVAGNDIGPVTVRIADRYGNGSGGGRGHPRHHGRATLASGAQTLTTDATGEVVFDPLTENLAGTYSSRGHGGGTRQPQVQKLHRLRRLRRPR